MPHILLIEDNPGDARLIVELLKESDRGNYEITTTHVERVADAVELLSNEHDIDLILSDITLPDSSGMETLSAMSQAAGELPILFMTGTNDEALAMAAIHQGAQDYIVKGRYNGDALSRAIQYAIERQKFQNDMQRVLAEAREDKTRLSLLTQRQRQLIELNRAKDEFISLASHQLRTPASVVKQYLGLIIEGHFGDVDPQIYKFVKTAYESNDRQLIVINDLLKTAQLDADNYKLDLRPQNVVELVRDVANTYKATLEMREQTIVFEAADSVTGCVDAHELQIVVDNVIGNASKYSPAGTTITIKIEGTKHAAKISIHDEGVGIDSNDQKRIFQKFTRIDNDLSDTVDGSGLGLYWARKIMRLHKGTITVDSKQGSGSTFTLTVPIV